MNYKRQLAQELLAIQAVSLRPRQPYTWASGLKSPIYCDNRITLGYPEVRSLITEGLMDLIKHHFPDAEAIAGTATAGIAQAALVAYGLNLPMAYVRSKAKDHGKQNQIEGYLAPGAKVVVVEDLISTGNSCLDVCQALRSYGVDVLGVVANFTYQFKVAQEQFLSARISYVTITDYSTLIDCAADQQVITESERKLLKEWSDDPQAWGAKHSSI